MYDHSTKISARDEQSRTSHVVQVDKMKKKKNLRIRVAEEPKREW